MSKANVEGEKIFLQMQLNKALERDKDGNVIFTVEASNENLDLQGQRVLQSALLDSRDYFLNGGVVSKDHKHRKLNLQDGTYDTDLDYVIGEPIDVYAKGNSTFVKGKLYSDNPHAKKFINLLEQGSSRVRASVGGLVPKVKNVLESGKKVGNVVSVLWDDLALTIQPVNHTVGAATSIMAKSLSSDVFVKTLTAGGGADAAQFTGGRALQPENVGRQTAAVSLVDAIREGHVTDTEMAIKLLIRHGVSKQEAEQIAQAVCKKSNIFTEANMGKWDKLIEGFGLNKAKNRKDEDDILIDDNGNEADAGNEEKEAVEMVKSLCESIVEMQENIKTMEKSQTQMLERLETYQTMLEGYEAMQKSIGENMAEIVKRTEEMEAAPTPRKAAIEALNIINKSINGNITTAAGGKMLKPFTAQSAETVRGLLIKAVQDGELDVYKSAKFETQINKSVNNISHKFSDDFVQFVSGKVKQ